MALKRFVNGAEEEPFFQKRAPSSRPAWIETAELRFPSGRTADEVVLRDAAGLAWVANLGCIDLNPHPVLASDLDHPDELRVDLDPVPGVRVAADHRGGAVRRATVLSDFGLTGWAKTSGSRGMHIYARIAPRWSFADVRRAAVAVAREIERRVPDLATSKWWKEERHGVFVDYNQNAKDRTVASAYSVRPLPDARVSTPLTWDEVPDVRPVRVHHRHGARPLRADRRPLGGHRRRRRARSTRCLSRRRATRPPACPTPRGRRTTRSRRARTPASSRRSAARRSGRRRRVGRDRRGRRRGGAVSPTGRRKSTKPLIEIARAKTKAEAMEGLERWKARHSDVWPLLEPADVLVDSMRGRSSTWTRIRVNLEHVPEEQRPPQEPLEVDYDPWAGYRGEGPA